MLRTTGFTLSLLPAALSPKTPVTHFLPFSSHPALRPQPFDHRHIVSRHLSISSTVLDTSRSLTSSGDLDPYYLSCSMPNKRLKVAVLLSGGVDSSVALRLLHAAGHSCTAFYLKIWFQEDFENFWSECPWEEDLKYAKAVCNQEEVRKLAWKFDLPNKDRKDSQGICFLGKIKFSEFVARHIGEMEGVILEAETGDFLGKHRGFWFYTIGQRQGLRLPGGPWYVVEKDVKNNAIFVSRNYFSFNKRRRLFRVGSLKWLGDSLPSQMTQLQCKVRHGPGFYNCNLTMEFGEDRADDVAIVQLFEDDQGLAAGQFAAFYQGRTCLGSGVILESRDDRGFRVCGKALEVAAMEDKSKLGKPVKIKTKQEEACVMESEQNVKQSCGAADQRKWESQHKSNLLFPLNWLQQLRNIWLKVF